jgi:hypothetical protein
VACYSAGNHHPDTNIRVFTGLSAGELAGHAGAYLAGRAAA